jgi:hypothetical protein
MYPIVMPSAISQQAASRGDSGAVCAVPPRYRWCKPGCRAIYFSLASPGNRRYSKPGGGI